MKRIGFIMMIFSLFVHSELVKFNPGIADLECDCLVSFWSTTLPHLVLPLVLYTQEIIGYIPIVIAKRYQKMVDTILTS